MILDNKKLKGKVEELAYTLSRGFIDTTEHICTLYDRMGVPIEVHIKLTRDADEFMEAYGAEKLSLRNGIIERL